MKGETLPLGCWVLVAMIIAAMAFVLLNRGRTTVYEGTYIRYSKHAFGQEWDTLLIQQKNHDYYHITRKWKYERVLDGAAISPQYKVFHSSALYQSKENVLIEEQTGLRYHQKGDELFVGETMYRKLN